MNVLEDFSLNTEDFQLRDFFEMLSFKSYSLFHSPCNCHFVRILSNAMHILGCHAALNIVRWLTLLKIAIALPVLYISYIEHRDLSSFDSV